LASLCGWSSFFAIVSRFAAQGIGVRGYGLGDRLGEIRKQHVEPEPQRDRG
jgi:hypothetical protein